MQFADPPRMSGNAEMWTRGREVSLKFLRAQSAALPACIQNDCIIEWLQYVDKLRAHGVREQEISGQLVLKIQRTIAEETSPADPSADNV